MGISNISQGFAGFPLVGRHPVAGVPERIFASGRVSLITPRLKIGFRPVRQEHAPRGLEVAAGLVEGRGGAALVLAPMRARIEAATTIPTDRCPSGCRCGPRSCPRGRRRSMSVVIRRCLADW